MRPSELAAGESANPLLPNGTFIVVAIIFAIVLFVIWRFVVPPIRTVMTERHDRAQQTIDDNAKATKRFDAAEKRYHEALHDARAESGRIRDEARAEGQRIIDEMREQAHSEVAEIQRRGEDELATQRQRVVSELRTQVGGFSTTLASRVIGEEVTVGARHRDTVDRFLSELGGEGDSR